MFPSSAETLLNPKHHLEAIQKYGPKLGFLAVQRRSNADPCVAVFSHIICRSERITELCDVACKVLAKIYCIIIETDPEVLLIFISRDSSAMPPSAP